MLSSLNCPRPGGIDRFLGSGAKWGPCESSKSQQFQQSKMVKKWNQFTQIRNALLSNIIPRLSQEIFLNGAYQMAVVWKIKSLKKLRPKIRRKNERKRHKKGGKEKGASPLPWGFEGFQSLTSKSRTALSDSLNPSWKKNRDQQEPASKTSTKVNQKKNPDNLTRMRSIIWREFRNNSGPRTAGEISGKFVWNNQAILSRFSFGASL